MHHEPKQLQLTIERAAPPDLELAFRPMFGGILAYAGGKPLASLSNVGLALKLSGADREELLALPGAEPLRYAPDQPPSKSYVTVPDRMLSDHGTLREWIRRSAAMVKQGPARGKRSAG